MYTSKHIIPQVLYIDLYIMEVEILADFLLGEISYSWQGGDVVFFFLNQPFLKHLRIYLHKKKSSLYIIIKKKQNKKTHSHKNITFEIINSTSVSDKSCYANVQSCIVLNFFALKIKTWTWDWQ